MNAAAPARPRLHLRLNLAPGPAALPLDRVLRVTGYATLSGEPDDYFAGWLSLHGEPVPVFDLNRVLHEQPTPATFGTRIILLEAAANAPTRHIGLLAAGVTDTTLGGEGIEPLDLDSFLPMLYPLTPALPVAQPAAQPAATPERPAA